MESKVTRINGFAGDYFSQLLVSSGLNSVCINDDGDDECVLIPLNEIPQLIAALASFASKEQIQETITQLQLLTK